MSELYERIENFCKERKINITQMCREANVPRAALTDLKMGRSKELSIKTLGRIADYFGVSVDAILGNEQKKETPTPKSERDYEDERILDALDRADPATREAILLLLKLR